MDYLEIILNGYFNENNREFLNKYFYREFKKAEKELFFEADEFFKGCLKIIESWEQNLNHQVLERKKELSLLLTEAKNGTLSYYDSEEKTIEQKRKNTIGYCEQELNDIRPDGIGSLTFTVHLNSLTNGRVFYNMSYNELLFVKLAILNAFEKTQTNIQSLPPQIISSETKPIKYKADEYALAYIFELWANDKQVPENRIEGGYNAKEIKRIGKEIYRFDKPDTFYRAVKKVLNYDLNKTKDLQNISKDWQNAVKSLSNKWIIIEQYLRSKNLIVE